MTADVAPFDFEYLPAEVAFGRGCVDSLGARLAEAGLSRALVVTGTNVGANDAVMDPVRAGLGDGLVDVFAETTPVKDVATAYDGVSRLRETDADCVVAVGSGSTLNVARAVCLLDALDRPRADALTEMRETGTSPRLADDAALVPNVVVPTTMAGADLTYDGSVSLANEPGGTDGDHAKASMGEPRLMPTLAVYDPALFETTPVDVLAPSAMNGFDKGIETVYSRRANPLSEAHALQGLRYLRDGLPGLREAALAAQGEGADGAGTGAGSVDDEALGDEAVGDGPDGVEDPMAHAVVGIVLVQYGKYTNFVHTFGNAISTRYDVIQGTVHGMVVPHALRYVFDRVEGRRRRIARALGVVTEGLSDDEVVDALIDEVVALRDALGMPERLRDVPGIERDDLPEVAETIVANRKHERNPPGIDPTVDDVVAVLEAAW